MWEETSKEDLKATVPTVSRLSTEPDLRVMVYGSFVARTAEGEGSAYGDALVIAVGEGEAGATSEWCSESRWEGATRAVMMLSFMVLVLEMLRTDDGE